MDRMTTKMRKQQWLDGGCDVMEIDHNWCFSIYTKDPNDNLVEFCRTTGELNEADREFALNQLETSNPDFSKPSAKVEVHKTRATQGSSDL